VGKQGKIHPPLGCNRPDLHAPGVAVSASREIDPKTTGTIGYVCIAIERVTGTLGGRAGTFILQHSGTMKRGTPQLTIRVVPDSGTGELAGLVGQMAIAAESRCPANTGDHFTSTVTFSIFPVNLPSGWW
jgi:hypothetical protein